MKSIAANHPWKKEARQILTVLLALTLITAGSVYIFLDFYGRYIDGVLYAERLSQMREVTTQLFTNLEEVVDNQWQLAQTQSNYLLETHPATAEELLSLMSQQARLNVFNSSQSEMMAVDDTGRYYTQNGMQGTLSGLNYLADQPQQVCYVYNTMTTGQAEMVFLLKLEKPLPIQVGSQTATLTYYGVSRNMTELNPYFSCTAYDGNNSVYVLDSRGTKLFSDTENTLLQGHNLYTVLGQMEYLHGSSFSKAKQELSQHRIAYSNAVLNGEEYYYSLYQMENAQWTLLFLVPSVCVAANTVSLINTTVRLILIFAILLLGVCVAAIYVVLRLKQKQVIDTERRNSKALSAINQELDRKNAELEKVNTALSSAVETAEHATQAAKAASAAKSDFLANMSHDIRTPMNAIVGITSLMEHEEGISDQLHTYISKVQMSSRHLLSLINDILDMSKIESNEIHLNSEPVRLAEQVGQVDSIIRSQAAERGQTLHIRVHEIVHEYLIGDGVRLRQIFINLLSNAVKYTPYGGTITFDLAEQPCAIPGHAAFTLSVTDNGCGMTPEFVAHIFEPFTRAEGSVTNRVQGTGLGMAITKSIVDLMGGSIHIESEPGKGSRFDVSLTLPIDRSSEYEVDARSVLLISDEEALIRNMGASLQETPVLFSAASTREEALRLLKQDQADVILLAGQLHDQSLPETVQLLRQTARDAVLIFRCDYAQQEQVHDILLQSGVDGLIARPFFRMNLIRAVDSALSEVAPQQWETASVLKGMRFLCAEDHELNAEILQAILEMRGASCTIYPDGAALTQAFSKVQPGEYDAILMDIQMPNMNGLEAARAIRASSNPLGRTIPIVAMTANAFAEDVQSCMDAGMDAHVSKPLDVAVLERTIRGFLTPPRVRERQTIVCEEN